MRNFFVALISMIYILSFYQAAFGAVITGMVTLDIKDKPAGQTVSAAYTPLAGATVSIITPTNAPLAEGATDAQGKFEISDVAASDGEWLVVTVATGTESLSGIYTGKDIVIDPVSDAFARSILTNQDVVGNFTIDEIELIKVGLYATAASADLAGADTAAESVEALLSYEPFRLALGDLLFTYSSPGDNIVNVQEIIAAFDPFIQNFHKLDDKTIAEITTPDTEIEFEGQFVSSSELMKQIVDFNTRFDVREWNVSYVRFALQDNTAQVETIENVFFIDKDSKEEVRDSLGFIHEMIHTGEKWILKKRYAKKCVPEKTTILADKSSWDWFGASPCMLSFHGKSSESGYRADIYSVYFAMDELQFYWRMEIDIEQIMEALNSGSADISYIVSLLDRVDNEGEKDVYSVVGVKNGVPYAVNQIRRIAVDGFPEQLTYLPNNFIVTPGYVEGTISLEELKAMGNEFYANVRILLDTDKAKSQILAEGIPTLVRLNPDM